MNNVICCKCLDCGNSFLLGVPDLLAQDQGAVIGDIVWCGICDRQRYACFWGSLSAGDSTHTIRAVLGIWNRWASSYRASQLETTIQNGAIDIWTDH